MVCLSRHGSATSHHAITSAEVAGQLADIAADPIVRRALLELSMAAVRGNGTMMRTGAMAQVSGKLVVEGTRVPCSGCEGATRAE